MAQRAAELLRAELQAVEPVHGGDLSVVVRIVLADGRQAAVKGGPAPRAEADMLTAIAASGAPAPTVLAVDNDVLVVAWLPESAPIGTAWEGLGAVLSSLHASSADRYGWDTDYAFGPVEINNAWHDSWTEFWAQRRLLVNSESVPAQLRRRIERLAGDLESRLPNRPTAALLHGDLWSGNVLACGKRITGLIDPACYYGHREVDLAMLSLFAQPQPEFYDIYGPLDPGHEARVAVYQLWPALVHLRLFGQAYLPMVERLLSAAGV